MQPKTCRICQELKNEEDLQELNCHHTFCTMCLSVYPGALCPTRFCSGTRSMDVVVDEMAGMDSYGSTQISFGSTSSLFNIDMEERLKCEGTRKGHACVNIARLVLVHCRHRICYDCLLEKVQNSMHASKAIGKQTTGGSPASDQTPVSLIHCPIPRCCNVVSKSEIRVLSANSDQFRRLCEKFDNQLPEINLPYETKPTSMEIIIECFVYGREHNRKAIVLPIISFVCDAMTACINLMRIKSSQSTSTIDVYIRKECAEKRGKFKYEKVPFEGKCNLKDAGWTNRTTLVIDNDKQIGLVRKR